MDRLGLAPHLKAGRSLARLSQNGAYLVLDKAVNIDPDAITKRDEKIEENHARAEAVPGRARQVVWPPVVRRGLIGVHRRSSAANEVLRVFGSAGRSHISRRRTPVNADKPRIALGSLEGAPQSWGSTFFHLAI
jgi:hypothetical protein